MKFGENVRTTMAGALKHRGSLLRDNLRNLPERKALRWEGLKCRDACMWKIIVGDPRQNRCGRRNLSAWCPKEFQKSSGPETKALRWEALSATTQYLKFENYSFLSHSIQIRIRWNVSLRHQGYKQRKVGVDPHFSHASPLDRRDSLFICEKLIFLKKLKLPPILFLF